MYYCPDLVGDHERLGLAATARRSRDPGRAAGQGRVRQGLVPRVARRLAGRRRALPGVRLADAGLPADPLVLVAESVEKPGNLGAMLRTAEAAGVDAVVAASAVTDWGNPNVVRASKGTVFAVPIASARPPT